MRNKRYRIEFPPAKHSICSPEFLITPEKGATITVTGMALLGILDLPSDLHRVVTHLAEERDISIRALLREALDNYVRNLRHALIARDVRDESQHSPPSHPFKSSRVPRQRLVPRRFPQA